MNVTYQREILATCLDEMKQAMLQEHWQELAKDKDKVALSPNYAKYFQLENAGELYVATIRNDGELIGYYIGFLQHELHYQDCFACIMDIVYLKPEYRKSKIGFAFFTYMKAELQQLGVHRWHVGCKLDNDLSGLFKALGFAPIEVYHSMYIGEA